MTVVLAVSDDESLRIDPCLDSLRAQTHRNLEILVVPYGRSDRVCETAARHAADDWRIRIDYRGYDDRAAARNAGAANARGSHLLFVAGGDDVLPGGVQRLVGSLARSGSDLAVGMLEAPGSLATPSTDSPYDIAHKVERRGVTLADAPVAVTDLGVGNRMFLRRFWREAGLAFTPGIPSGSDLVLTAYSRAASFDLLADATYIPTNRAAGVTVGAMADLFSRLEPWIEEHEDSWRAVHALAVPDVEVWWLWGVLDSAIHPFLDDVERASDEQWSTLRHHVNLLLEHSGDEIWSKLRAESRVKLWLLRHDRRTRLEEYVAARWFERGNRPTEVVDGQVLAHLPFFGDQEVGVPAECYVMGESETPLRVALRGVRWTGPATLELDLFARIEYVGFVDRPQIEVALVPDGAGDPVPLATRQRHDPEANMLLGHRYQDYSHGAVTVVVDAAELSRTAAESGAGLTWTMELVLTTRGVTRRGTVNRIDDRGSAGLLDAGHLAPRRVDGFRVGPSGLGGAEMRLVARPDAGPRLRDVAVSGRTVTGTIDPAWLPLTGMRVSMGGLNAKARLSPAGDLVSFALEVPPPWAASGDRLWAWEATTDDGSTVPIGWPDSPQQWLAEGEGAVVPSRNAAGDCELLEAHDTVILDSVRLVGRAIEVAGHWLGAAPAHFDLELRGPRTTVAGEVQAREDGSDFTAQFPTTWDEWGLGATTIPTGRYWFGVDCGPGPNRRTGRVLVGGEVLDTLLEHTLTHDFRFRPIRLGRDAGVFLQPPWTPEESGPYAQAALQAWARSGEVPLDENAAYLQSYSGASATDSQLAIHHELRRRHPQLTVYWGIASRASTVPEGAVPVILQSREFYRVMASARYLCVNIDFDRWFHPRPGQQVLQTFHGYPAKSMGIRMWEAKRYTPRRIELELARTSGDWDLILTPAPEMDAYYRTEYRYDGPIHNAGYPRDDLLVSPDAERVREETRTRLGIQPYQKVVLYAPTWRDDLATTWRSAELVRHLDLESASRVLGPDYVFLMRGHRFHERGDQPGPRTARLIDVSDYPEVNHLILASDAAVLDYSSLRFDFALTRRPMLFLVPDLASYTGGVRGFLYDFTDTTPGPLLDTADEVVARLRDLPALENEYGAEYARFHDTYNYLMDGHAAERVVKAFFG